ncbi:molybdenum cofactor biosynthesis protein MoaE [Thermococcus sp.]|uniref:molybdenum cofactor biosynthesis protein MoaE n=1 Tax=Thermococcus sp. TaxID=35749 RepID=UPI00262169D8|nr:molybdenum cofactor biosynthesis protein MoaE [Thermococcus sp.]
MKVRLMRERFDIGEALSLLRVPECGAYVMFLGQVRNESHGRHVRRLIYEAYPEMAEGEMARIREEALRRFPILDALIWHRYGELDVGEDTILILVSAKHRKEAFEACSWLIDEVKKRVPVWKKEVTDEGTFWIEGDRAVKE